MRSLLRIDLAAALYHKGPPQQGPRRTLAPSGQPVGRRDIRKASENPQMFTPSRGSHKEEGFPDEPVMQPFALVLSLFLRFCLLCFWFSLPELVPKSFQSILFRFFC